MTNEKWTGISITMPEKHREEVVKAANSLFMSISGFTKLALKEKINRMKKEQNKGD